MQPGSSGSPLINSEKRIIGQLLGPGNIYICPPYQCDNPSLQVVAYGKFNVSWRDHSDWRRRLKNWLDPISTGQTTLDGHWVSKCVSTNYNNHNVTSNRTIKCTTINSGNTRVYNGNKLTFDAITVNLNNGFEIKNGAEFEVNIKK